MTEYDYSPDAYERYMATQQRIARWVDNTNRHPPSNPFVESPAGAAADPQGVNHSSSTPSSRATSPLGQRHTRYSERPGMLRSQTTPAPIGYGSTQQPRSSSHHASPTLRSRSTHRSSRSSSSRRTSGTTTTTTSFKTITPNKRSPTYVTPSDTQPILVPIDGGRRGYVIVPPTGTRMEVLSPSSSSHTIPSPNSERSRSRDTGKDGKPFLQRLFSGFASPGGKTYSNQR